MIFFFLVHIDQCKTRMDGILWHNNFDCFYVFDDDETNKPTQNTTNKQKKGWRMRMNYMTNDV